MFVAQNLSQVGKWSHDLARAWIVLTIIDKAWALGLVILMGAIPNLIASLPAGAMVDRSNTKKILTFSYMVLAVSSFFLAGLVESNTILLWHLFVFSFLEGLVISFSGPAYQVLILKLVPRSEFSQTMFLNTLNFHAGRMLGPIVAAVLMTWYGTSLVFLFDSFTYVVLMFILMSTNFDGKASGAKTQSNSSALLEGLKYIFKTPNLRYKMLQLFLSVMVFLPLSIAIYRTYLKLKFNLSADEFGYLFAFSASGALAGSMFFTIISPKKPMRYLWFAIPVVSLCVFAVPFMNSVWLTAPFLFMGAFCAYIVFSALTVSLHTDIEDKYRGRLGSLISLSFVSLGPLASYPIGAAGDYFGYPNCIWTLAAVFAVFSAYNAYKHHHLPIKPKAV